MKYIMRKNNNSQNIIIFPPTPEEILNPSFDYPNYIENILNTKIDFDDLENLYYSIPKQSIPVDPKTQNLFNNFENKIIKIQSIYENDLHAGTQTMDYNEEMKKIAKEYFQKLESLITYKLQKQKNLRDLTAKRAELLCDLKQVIEIKANIENNSSARLHSFINKKMPLGKLYLYDLIHIKDADINKRQCQALEHYRRQIFANLINEEGIYTKPIENLHIKGKK